MTTSTRIIPRGLVTEPSRLAAGDGGLIRAQNVICRAPGLVEPRAMLRSVQNTTAAAAGFGQGLHCREWNGETSSALTNESAVRVYRENESTNLTRMAGFDEDTDRVFSEVADGRAIWSFPNGLRCMDQSDQAAKAVNQSGADRYQGAFSRLPGAPRISAECASTGGSPTIGALAPQETCAFRVTIVRYITTDNGTLIPIEGPPSDRYLVVNDQAVNRLSALISYNLQNHAGGADDYVDIRNGDEIRVYRTVTNGTAYADPGDEMTLRHTEKVKFDALGNLDISSQDFVDNLPPGEWSGPALYTNESQEGATRANYRMRSTRDLATYQGKLFYGGGSAGYRKSVVIKHIGISSDTTDYSETLLSITSAAGNWTNGSPTITGVPANVFPYISVGQFVSTTGNNPVGSTFSGYIISFNTGAGTITLDSNATANGVGFTAYDWVAFTTDAGDKWRVFFPAIAPGGTVYPAVATPTGSYPTTTYGPIMPTQNNGTVNVPRHGGIESGFGDIYKNEFGGTSENLIPRMYTETGADPHRNIVLTIEWDASFSDAGTTDNLDVSTTGLPRITITSSKPYAFSEQLSPDYATSKIANPDGDVATLWWSKSNQPESVPLGNFAIIGDSSEPIVRIFGTTDRLWVLKTDGLFLAYGSGDTPDALTIQPVDSTFKMIDGPLANCSLWATKIRDTVYAWTQGGIVAIDTQGVRRIDEDIATLVRQHTPGFTATQTQEVSGATFCSASVRDQLVLFGIRGGICLCYAIDGGTWGTWTGFSPTGGAASLPGQRFGYGVSEIGALRLPGLSGYVTYVDVPSANTVNAPDTAPYTGDMVQNQTVTLNVSSVVGKNIVTTLTGFAIGTRFQASNGLWVRIVSGDPNAGTYTLDLAGCGTGLALEVHMPVSHVFTFSANQPPMTEKHFVTAWAHWQRIRGGTRYYVDWRARGHIANEASQFTLTYDDSDASGYPHTIDHDLEFDDAISTPTQVSRARGLEVTLTQNEADVYFMLDGFTLESKDETPRVERRR